MTVDSHEDRVLDPARVEALVARAEEEVREGLIPSCQLALALDGRVVVFETLGDATGESRYVVYSVTKAIVAGAAWVLLGGGALSTSTRVADVVPEFATNGKEAVTVEHLLTHTGGFPRAPMHPLEGGNREKRLERFRSWRLDWPPGTAYEYHPSSAHWVMAEVIERVTGGPYQDFVNERVVSPLGLTTLRLGVRRAEQTDVLNVEMVGQPPDEEELRALGIDNPNLMVAELGAEQLLRYNEPAVREVGAPGAGATSTAADVALYFQALLHDPAGVWDPAVLADGTGNVRVTFPDPYTGVPANRTLGLVVAGNDDRSAFRGFGFNAGPRTFGSPGVGGQVAWADPETGLSFCFLTNGLDADVVRAARRGISLSTLAAEAVRR